jgi:hypothetical protein
MKKLLTVIAFSLAILVLGKWVFGQELVDVSVEVGDTRLIISGYAFPEAYVTITEDGNVIGTVVADKAGYFYKELFAQEQGIRLIGLFGIDKDNRTTATAVYSLDLVSGIDNLLSNVILPPTITLSPQEISQGQQVTLFGYAPPAAVVTIFWQGEELDQIVADSLGYYQYHYDSVSQAVGTYALSVIAVIDNVVSQPSRIVSLTVMAPVVPTPTQTPTPTSTPAATLTSPAAAISPSATPSPTPAFAAVSEALSPFDIDKDGKLTLVGFEKKVKLWKQSWQSSLKTASVQGEICDLNLDNVCDLTDFSILLYYINR